MRPIFTVHAGEFLVAQFIERKWPDKNVWIPTKDTGIDLLVTDSGNNKSVSLQVKFSKDFLPEMKHEARIRKNLKSCTWFTLNRSKVEQSTAELWVLVLVGFEERSFDYLLISPSDLLKRLESLDGENKKYQVYIWVDKSDRAWLTRGLRKEDQRRLAEGTFVDAARDITHCLGDWSKVATL